MLQLSYNFSLFSLFDSYVPLMQIHNASGVPSTEIRPFSVVSA